MGLEGKVRVSESVSVSFLLIGNQKETHRFSEFSIFRPMFACAVEVESPLAPCGPGRIANASVGGCVGF